MNESGIQALPQQHYQELNNQVSTMSLDSQGNSARSDISGQSDKQQHQLTSPTSPVEVTAPTPAEIAAQRRHPHQVYYHSEQVQQAGQYQSVPGYAPPVQYIQQSIPAGYQNYQDQNVPLTNNSGQQQQQGTTSNNMQPPPSPTTPGILSHHYPAPNIQSPQTALIQPSPEQYMASLPGQLSGQRPRYPGAMVYPRGSTNQIYVPVAAQPQQVAMYCGQYVNGQKNYDFYRTNRMNNSVADTGADYRKVDPQYQQQYAALQQQNLSLAQQQQQQRQPLMQVVGNQQAYYHMTGPKR